jgi:putative FmdB family regulatory protein
MPIYEFVCKKCGNITENYYKLSQMKGVHAGSLKPVCGKCNSEETELIMSVCAIKINGYNAANGYSK